MGRGSRAAAVLIAGWVLLLPSGPSLGADDPLLARMARVSAVYRSAALRFSCNESFLEEHLAPRKGELDSRREATYRYLLQEGDGEIGITEFRRIESKGGIPVRPSEAVVQNPVPPPFLWATLFDAENASLFRFEVVGTERRGVVDTVIVAFEGQLEFARGIRLAEWSGRIWIDRDRLNPVHLEAEPARQEVALEVQLDRYRRAFRLAGIPLRSRPRAFRLSVEFLVTRFGLSFPSEATWRKLVLDSDGERYPEHVVRRRFGDYRFFEIQTEDLMEAIRSEGDGR